MTVVTLDRVAAEFGDLPEKVPAEFLGPDRVSYVDLLVIPSGGLIYLGAFTTAGDLLNGPIQLLPADALKLADMLRQQAAEVAP